eukprot:GHVU01182568.1.p1 GENE.GHVU01182568.1~~GHVU01182568.1.p1  ORF type:complete len:146 (+),score=5.71 GHVU01182568.1:307-744(+)
MPRMSPVSSHSFIHARMRMYALVRPGSPCVHTNMLTSLCTYVRTYVCVQSMDYQHWYDRSKIQLKEVSHTQYMASMNPAAGSFTVNPRLQRHFWTLAVPFPEPSSLFTIFSAFVMHHFQAKGFRQVVQDQLSIIIKAALSLHEAV